MPWCRFCSQSALSRDGEPSATVLYSMKKVDARLRVLFQRAWLLYPKQRWQVWSPIKWCTSSVKGTLFFGLNPRLKVAGDYAVAFLADATNISKHIVCAYEDKSAVSFITLQKKCCEIWFLIVVHASFRQFIYSRVAIIRRSWSPTGMEFSTLGGQGSCVCGIKKCATS